MKFSFIFYSLPSFHLKSVDVYNLQSNNWSKIPDMNQPRKSFGCVLLADGIYVFGGCNKSEYLKTCERYNFSLKKWESIPDMNEPRGFFTCIRSPDLRYVYVLGGYEKNNKVKRECER